MRSLRLTLIIILVNMIVLTTQSIAQDMLTKEIVQCAELLDNEARLHCYDNVSGHTSTYVEQVENRAMHQLISEVDTVHEKMGVNTNSTVSKSAANKKYNGNWLGLTPYRKNYILPVTYNKGLNQEFYSDSKDGFQADNFEIKYQLSFELSLWENLLEKDIDLYFAYTQRSFFQAFNHEYSEPFRDTTYEPELGIKWQTELQYMGWSLESVRFALNHQSNGRTKPLSRSWNRMIAQFKINKDNVSLGMRAWKRIDAIRSNDDNPDISDYLGYAELYAGYKLGEQHFGIMLRNPSEHSTFQVDWSYPFSENVRLYLQFFNGYGESLLDYDHRVNRIGVGFILNDWF